MKPEAEIEKQFFDFVTDISATLCVCGGFVEIGHIALPGENFTRRLGNQTFGDGLVPGTPTCIHSRPACRRFVESDPSTFVSWLRGKYERHEVLN